MADAENFRQIVTPSVKFKIPKYQRNYSWADEHINDLWRDLNNVMEDSDENQNSKSHFYGMFLFDVDKDGRLYKIIDGQQRITTAIILLNEIKNRFLELNLEDQANTIKSDYIEDGHGYKLSLGPEDDDRVFKDLVLSEDDLEGSIDSLADTPSQRRLLNAKQ